MIAQTLRAVVERRFQKWLTEQKPFDELSPSVQAIAIDTALAEIKADGITDVAQMNDFDLEGIWER